MTHQLDMMPAELVDAAVLDRIDAQLPKARDVRNPQLPAMFPPRQEPSDGAAMSAPTDVPRETNNPQLRWKRVSDIRMASDCDRYTVDREPHYDGYPAVGFRYCAKHADLQANPLGTFETFALAAAACEVDLTMQQTQKGQ